jgi:hypothetical protein
MKCDALETCFTAADMLYSSADLLYYSADMIYSSADMLFYLHADAAFTRTDSLETWANNNPSSGSKPFKVLVYLTLLVYEALR